VFFSVALRNKKFHKTIYFLRKIHYIRDIIGFEKRLFLTVRFMACLLYDIWPPQSVRRTRSAAGGGGATDVILGLLHHHHHGTALSWQCHCRRRLAVEVGNSMAFCTVALVSATCLETVSILEHEEEVMLLSCT
jgi:hypothetical protein